MRENETVEDVLAEMAEVVGRCEREELRVPGVGLAVSPSGIEGWRARIEAAHARERAEADEESRRVVRGCARLRGRREKDGGRAEVARRLLAIRRGTSGSWDDIYEAVFGRPVPSLREWSLGDSFEELLDELAWLLLDGGCALERDRGRAAGRLRGLDPEAVRGADHLAALYQAVAGGAPCMTMTDAELLSALRDELARLLGGGGDEAEGEGI